MLLQKKTRSANFNIVSILIKLFIVILIILGAVYLLNKIDFPSPKKQLKK